MSLVNCLPTNYTPSELIRIPIPKGESLTVKTTGMLAAKNLELTTELNGSIYSLVKRACFFNFDFFQNKFTAKDQDGWLSFEESFPGQITMIELKRGQKAAISRSAYFAADSNVTLKTNNSGGLVGWWKGIGASTIDAQATANKTGRVFFKAQEGIVTKTITLTKDDGKIILDDYNILAVTGNLEIKNRKIGDFKSFLFSGEGTVNEVSGEGQIFVGSSSSGSSGLSHPILRSIATSFIPSLKTVKTFTVAAMTYNLAQMHLSPIVNNLFCQSDSMGLFKQFC